MTKIRSVKPAHGVKGILIRVGDAHVFRIYGEGHSFVDYDILHHDLAVEILDNDAILYDSEFGNYLDYPGIDESK
jgi:hypothetical protein